MARPESTSVVEQIGRTLRDRIVSGELAPEAPLRQDHIAREFEVSIVPVREALRRLEGDGLVVFRPRHGAVVAPVSATDMWEVLEMRAVLEAMALRDAMRRHTPESLAELRAAVPEDGRPNWVGENRAFHMALCRPCGRQRLLAEIDELCLASERYVALLDSRTDYPANQRQQHQAILSHVAAGRTALALRQLREDILGGGREIVEKIDRKLTALPERAGR